MAPESVRVDLCIYRSIPPTHEYGTRPFLRWARSQGRSPHASGKAKNTFGPVGIPFLGRLRRQAINPTPRRGYKPGGMAPWGRRKSPVLRHTRQNRPEVRRPTECNPRTGEERPHTNALERPRGHLYLSLRPTNARIWHKAVFKVGPVAGPKPTRVRQGQKYLRPRRHSPFWGVSGTRQ